MALEHIIKHSCRLNIQNPKHKRINDVLVNLSPDVCKSKSQFFIDAADYYIQHYGKEAFTQVETDDSPYVTKTELLSIEKRTIEEAVTQARNEVIRLLGGVISGISNVQVLPRVEAKAVMREEESEEDDTVLDYASSFMDGLED